MAQSPDPFAVPYNRPTNKDKGEDILVCACGEPIPFRHAQGLSLCLLCEGVIFCRVCGHPGHTTFNCQRLKADTGKRVVVTSLENTDDTTVPAH